MSFDSFHNNFWPLSLRNSTTLSFFVMTTDVSIPFVFYVDRSTHWLTSKGLSQLPQSVDQRRITNIILCSPFSVRLLSWKYVFLRTWSTSVENFQKSGNPTFRYDFNSILKILLYSRTRDSPLVTDLYFGTYTDKCGTFLNPTTEFSVSNDSSNSHDRELSESTSSYSSSRIVFLWGHTPRTQFTSLRELSF